MIIIIIGLTLSFVVVYYTIPYAIRTLNEHGHTIPDRYKSGYNEVPNHGAVVVLFTVLLVCAFMPLLAKILNRLNLMSGTSQLDEIDLAIMLVISTFGLFGIIDDLINTGWWTKIFIPTILVFPLLVVVNPETLSVPFVGDFDLNKKVVNQIAYSDIFKVIIVPVYVMVVANLINMHSGFNGLQSGLSAFLIFTVLLKCFAENNYQNTYISASFLGGVIAFWLFNRYPSKIFEGNVGSLVFGACIGTLLVVKDLYVFGVIILAPHILDFLMLLYLRISGMPFIKFGSIDTEGKIQAPNAYKLKFLITHYYSLTEREAVNVLYLITISFCIIGFILT